jgi:hypothetical protein
MLSAVMRDKMALTVSMDRLRFIRFLAGDVHVYQNSICTGSYIITVAVTPSSKRMNKAIMLQRNNVFFSE